MSTTKPCTRCRTPFTPLRRGLCQNCYQRERKKVGYQSSYVDAAPVRAHIVGLLEYGLLMADIARVTGLSQSALNYIVKGRPGLGQRPAEQVARKTAYKVFSVQAGRPVEDRSA